MATDGIRLTLEDEGVKAELDRLARAADDAAPAYNAIGAYLVFSTQRRFETETGPDGRKWTPLSPRTANRRIGRERRGYMHILRQTTRLYRSISYDAGPNYAVVGSNVRYAAIHQLGGEIKQQEREQTVYLKKIRRKGGFRTRFARKNAQGAEARTVSIKAHTITIPARPYLGISAEDRDEIAAIVVDHLDGEAQP